MKKILLIIFFFSFRLTFAQELERYTFDENLSLSLPQGVVVTDSISQRVAFVRIGNGHIVIVRMPVDSASMRSIDNEEAIIGFYAGVQSGNLDAVNGELISESNIYIDSLIAKRNLYQTLVDEELQITECRYILLNNMVYMIQYTILKSMDNEVERNLIFDKVKFKSGYSIKDQMGPSLANKIGYDLGYFLGNAIAYSVFIGILALIFFGIRKLVKKKEAS